MENRNDKAVLGNLADINARKNIVYRTNGAGDDIEHTIPVYLVIYVKKLENFDFEKSTVSICIFSYILHVICNSFTPHCYHFYLESDETRCRRETLTPLARNLNALE